MLHFREALEIAGAPADEPDLAPGARAGARRVGAGASTAATSSSSRATRRRNRRVLHPPRPRRPALVAQSFDLLFRGLELVSGGQRLHRYADYVARARGRAGYPLRAVRVVPRGVPARHPAARRLRDRAGALGRPAGRGGQHPRGHAVPARPAPAGALTGSTATTQDRVAVRLAVRADRRLQPGGPLGAARLRVGHRADLARRARRPRPADAGPPLLGDRPRRARPARRVGGRRRAHPHVPHRPQPTRVRPSQAHGEVFADVRPASTMLVVVGMLDPRWVVEVELDAVLAAPGG